MCLLDQEGRKIRQDLLETLRNETLVVNNTASSTPAQTDAQLAAPTCASSSSGCPLDSLATRRTASFIAARMRSHASMRCSLFSSCASFGNQENQTDSPEDEISLNGTSTVSDDTILPMSATSESTYGPSLVENGSDSRPVN